MRKFTEKTLLIASHNQGKLEEIQDLFKNYPISIISAAGLGLPEPIETEHTFVGNARLKAHFAAKAANMPALADDSGIMIDALDGAPGVYTADWTQTPNGRDFNLAMQRSHALLEEKQAPHPRLAQFCCTLVLAWPDGHDEVFTGTMQGQIVWPPRGALGHGYDPIFQPDGYEQTFSQMDRFEKNKISHRGKAFDRLIKGCFTS